MKILVISNYRETVSVRPEAELFIGLQRAGVTVEIMTHPDAEYVAKFRAAGIRVYAFHPQKKLDKKEIKAIREVLVEGRHDILHLFNSKAILNGIQAAKGLPVKVALYRGYTGNIHWYDPTAYLKYLHPRVDGIWCIAESIQRQIDAQFFFGKQKTVFIRKGHAPAWYRSTAPLDRRVLSPIPADGFWVAHVANNRPMKGTAYLLKAMQRLRPGLPLHLLLIGKNLDTPGHRRILMPCPNKDNIHFLGYRTDVLNIVRACDAFVLSSIFGEATTKAVIEAMSLGTVPVITDIPGNQGLVVHGKCGLVVPPRNPKAIAEALVTLCENRDLCNNLGQAARAHIAEKFHLDTTVLEMKKWYEKLARGS